MPNLGCELTNVGAAVDEIMAVYDQTAGALHETSASLEGARATVADAADQGRLFDKTKSKLATAEKRIEAYHTDRSKVLTMFQLAGVRRRQNLADIIGAHLATDKSNLTAVSNMRDQYNATCDTIIDRVNALTLVMNPQAMIRRTFTNTADKQQHAEEALQLAAKAFRKVYVDRYTLDTAVNDRQRMAEQLNMATTEITNSRARHDTGLLELEALKETVKRRDGSIERLTHTINELEQARLHEANDDNNICAPRNARDTRFGGTRNSPIEVDDDITKADRPQKSAADTSDNQHDANQDKVDKSSEENGNPSTSKRQAPEDASPDVNADGEPGDDASPQRPAKSWHQYQHQQQQQQEEEIYGIDEEDQYEAYQGKYTTNC